MIEVQLLRGYRNLRDGEKAGFEDAEAEDLIARGLARLVKRDVPETAGLGGDGVTADCPHCKKGLLITPNGDVRAETAADARMQPGAGKPRQAEARA